MRSLNSPVLARSSSSLRAAYWGSSAVIGASRPISDLTLRSLEEPKIFLAMASMDGPVSGGRAGRSKHWGDDAAGKPLGGRLRLGALWPPRPSKTPRLARAGDLSTGLSPVNETGFSPRVFEGSDEGSHRVFRSRLARVPAGPRRGGGAELGHGLVAGQGRVIGPALAVARGQAQRRRHAEAQQAPAPDAPERPCAIPHRR